MNAHIIYLFFALQCEELMVQYVNTDSSKVKRLYCCVLCPITVTLMRGGDIQHY